MKITDIKQQRRRKDRFNIHVDGKFKFALSEEEMVKNRLEIGKEVEKTEIKGLKEVDERSKVYNKALEYLSRRSHSEYELKEKLRRKKLRGDLIDDVINRLGELGYIDDKKFCREYIEGRIRSSPRGRMLLKRELLQKGVAGELIERIIDLVYNKDTEINALTKLVGVRKKRLKGDKKDRERLISFLLRRGFIWDDIREVLS